MPATTILEEYLPKVLIDVVMGYVMTGRWDLYYNCVVGALGYVNEEGRCGPDFSKPYAVLTWVYMFDDDIPAKLIERAKKRVAKFEGQAIRAALDAVMVNWG